MLPVAAEIVVGAVVMVLIVLVAVGIVSVALEATASSVGAKTKADVPNPSSDKAIDSRTRARTTSNLVFLAGLMKST